jgi:hypothetical protein
MTPRRPAILAAAVSLIGLGIAGCTITPATAPNVVLPFENTEYWKTTNKSDLSFVPPTDPRYSENGAPRVGEPTGESIAGDPALVGVGKSYAPITHKGGRQN